MEELFKNHLRSKKLLDQNKIYLLAISGGIDSVCLGYLLRSSGIGFAIAHVNFGLREKESDGDEAFVRSLAKEWGVELHLINTNIKELDEREGSLQMAAREFRYEWFDQVLKSNGYEALLVAHHADDQLETIFLNLLRGTGIEGIYGMSEVRGDIIRPLLGFSSAEIISYMVQNSLKWREDSSNQKNEYKRNILRNKVFPLLEEGFTEGLKGMDSSFSRLKDTGKAFFFLYEKWKNEMVIKEGDYQYLSIKEIGKIPGKHSMLYYWLRDFGFSFADVQDVFTSIEKGESGKTFYAGESMLNKDRDYLILGKNDFEWEPKKIEIHDISILIKDKKYDILQLQGEIDIDKSKENAMLDFDKLMFPLVIKKWKSGDRFIPLGMDKPKKISDLLVDLKVPLIQKKQVLVLWSGGEIAWVVGIRIGELFKCDSKTKKVLYFKNR
ncbi:tRNA lysidine(34) synthetase TilS [Aquiflexum gelatinilyticum]|uniref:tRNA(Ile)-lysidine synthase n=1 Tax=Aquiflexum gelatinilyticum TaxID=2961943 RepID=A0A9X2P842_9BACT|nr:tRNA lysidine(34) synthetase TilS [Aquiflexum gelatinilyticum]MCR9017167.1 tRNA lysidine(34) synthetase TilS [Aquiflexum gelatinilyticum]